MKHCHEVLHNINWTRLRKQKEYCLNEAANNKDADEIYQGIANLFDHLQDAAILDKLVTEEEVFGDESDDEDRPTPSDDEGTA